MKQVAALLENGTGPNLIDSRSFPSNLANRIKPVKDPESRGTTSEKKRCVGGNTISNLHRRPQGSILVGVVHNFVLKVLLGTSFIDRLVKRTLT